MRARRFERGVGPVEALGFLGVLGLLGLGCSGEPCTGLTDCPLGSYCVLDQSSSRVSGTCTQDCFEAKDCPGPSSSADRAICDNEGRCQIVPRLPRLRLRSPEPGETRAADTRTLAVAGEVETASRRARVIVEPIGNEACPGGAPIQIELVSDGDAFRDIPFLVDGLEVDAFTRGVRVTASVGPGVQRTRSVAIEPACTDCQIGLDAPARSTETSLRILDRLAGFARPDDGLIGWRVRGGRGGLFDGTAAVDPATGRFEVRALPLFAGRNQLEVVAWRPDGELRCTSFVRAPGVARGLRAVLTWDTDGTDFDLHLVGPGGRFGEPGEDLSPATGPAFGGTVDDDFDGRGPESLDVAGLPDGTYGLVVEPLRGSGTAVVRVFDDGAPLAPVPAGPRYLDAAALDLWVVGRIQAESGRASFEPLDERLDRAAPPTRPPEDWPDYF